MLGKQIDRELVLLILFFFIFTSITPAHVLSVSLWFHAEGLGN